MRIVAGEFRGRQLVSPTWEGLRPTSDRLRETLFNILGPSIAGARVLDGYAGTGAIGIEALSRGAAHVTFVEKDPRAAKLIETNLALVGLSRRSPRLPSSEGGPSAIIRAGVEEAVARLSGQSFDLIILDPPYGNDAAETAIAAIMLLAGPDTRIVVEHASRYAPPETVERGAALRLRRTVKSGDSTLSFYGH